MAIPDPDDDPAPMHILVVEDEPLIRAVLADELRDAGFCVVEAANADEALDYVRSNQPFDLLFTDVQMPGTIDGLELARKLRQLHPSLPMIITSGAIAADQVKDGAQFLPKPYRQDAALALVFTVLGVRPGSAE